METENPERQKALALQELEMLKQMALQLGNNEGESNAIEQLSEQVRNNKIHPNEAVLRGRAIINSKNER